MGWPHIFRNEFPIFVHVRMNRELDVKMLHYYLAAATLHNMETFGFYLKGLFFQLTLCRLECLEDDD